MKRGQTDGVKSGESQQDELRVELSREKPCSGAQQAPDLGLASVAQ